MAYEIDFIGVGSDIKKDADAICLRWKVGCDNNGNPQYHIAVYDGGFEDHGKAMADHMNRYYFDDPLDKKNPSEKVIDFVIVSHPDQDHTIGLRTILEQFSVKYLFMNRPWLYVDELFDKVNDRRITKETLKERLREKYKTIADLDDIAKKRGVAIEEAFQGNSLDQCLLICSPSKEFYLDLLVESDKTPLTDQKAEASLVKYFKKAKEYVLSLLETWKSEKLRDNVKTSPENETSVVIRGLVDNSGFLLCGDAGIRALTQAMDFLESRGENIQENASFYEIPHHGSRRNISPAILNRLIGDILDEGETRKLTAFASVAKDSDHPLKMVTNAYIRRGVTPYKTQGGVICHHEGEMPDRGWTAAVTAKIEFSDNVEEWDD